MAPPRFKNINQLYCGKYLLLTLNKACKEMSTSLLQKEMSTSPYAFYLVAFQLALPNFQLLIFCKIKDSSVLQSEISESG